MAKDTKETKAPIFGILSRSHKELIGKRAEIAGNSLIYSNSIYIGALQKEINDAELELMNLEDFGPDCSTSLRVTSRDFNSDKWIKDVHEATLKLDLLYAKLKSANKVTEKFFV